MAVMIRLLVGLGNPGDEYCDTRHNAGAQFVEALVRRADSKLKAEKKLKSHGALLQTEDYSLRVAVPDVYMNHSGEAAVALMNFYKIAPEQVLVAHDEIDLPPGDVRLKFGGGTGGHNGLRSIESCLGSRQFYRLRIGVGHPGHRDRVVRYVLSPPCGEERNAIEDAIDHALTVMPQIVAGDFEKAMTRLHSL